MFTAFLLVSNVSAHEWRLNSEGCHNNYKERTYHCHDEDGEITSSEELDWSYDRKNWNGW